MTNQEVGTRKPYASPEIKSMSSREILQALGPAVASVYQDPLTGLGD